MKQYCRYCGFCIESDFGFYCTDHNEELTEAKVKRVNHCPDYGFINIDVFDEKRKYKPRPAPVNKIKKISLFGEVCKCNQ